MTIVPLFHFCNKPNEEFPYVVKRTKLANAAKWATSVIENQTITVKKEPF